VKTKDGFLNTTTKGRNLIVLKKQNHFSEEGDFLLIKKQVLNAPN
jgi:hypothetical protein